MINNNKGSEWANKDGGLRNMAGKQITEHRDVSLVPHFASHDHAHFERLRRKLRWQLLVAYATPLVLISLYFHYQYSSTLETEVHAHLRSVAENQRNTVDLYLSERVANVSTAFRAGVFRVSATGADMTDADMMEVLTELREDNDTFSDVGLFDPDGTLVAYAGPHTFLRGRSYRRESWFQCLHKGSQDHYISDVFLGFRGRPHFVIAVRRTIDGKPWTLRASVDPHRFAAFVGRSHLVSEGEAFIINRSGNRQTITGQEKKETGIEHMFQHSRETRVVELDSDGQSCIAAVAWLLEHDWAVVVRVPQSIAYAPLLMARFAIGGIVLFAVVLTILLALRNTRRFVGDLETADVAKEALRRQLFSAAKLASVGEMAAGVAHEINNPLAIIHEEAGVMMDVLDPEFAQNVDLDEFRERLDAITCATMRGRDVTAKLLAFSRRHESAPQSCDVNEIVAAALQIKETDFRVSDIETLVDLERNLPEVMVNRNEMEQVLLNLLNNAKDAIDRSGKITVRTTRSGSIVVIRIEDTGCGMTEEQIEQVFFPFFTTKEVGKGTGLGMSISLGIIETFGGHIDVESEAGIGTSFTITLPGTEAKPADATH